MENCSFSVLKILYILIFAQFLFQLFTFFYIHSYVIQIEQEISEIFNLESKSEKPLTNFLRRKRSNIGHKVDGNIFYEAFGVCL